MTNTPPSLRLRVHHFLPHTRVEGPGLRACLWVQGCPIRCAGCFSPHTWSDDGGQWMDVAALAQAITQDEEIEGVTFLGGEPFAQAGPLAGLAQAVRGRGLSVLTFSGYTWEQLNTCAATPQGADWAALLAATDLLIAGPFDRTRVDLSRPWAGSANQTYHFLTPRYAHLAPQLGAIPNRLEVRLAPDGGVSANGLATTAQLGVLRRLAGGRLIARAGSCEREF